VTARELPPLPGVEPSLAPGPDSPEYAAWVERTVFSPEGVDRMLLWEALHQTPAERLQTLRALASFPPPSDGDGLP
jgi:hypothetical protein